MKLEESFGRVSSLPFTLPRVSTFVSYATYDFVPGMMEIASEKSVRLYRECGGAVQLGSEVILIAGAFPLSRFLSARPEIMGLSRGR